ncbi:uncharacterized protein LOC127415917 [Myxocyprinus asiaticus]|uniref:uncharacterized protein LOC127415917 n=1 Tax=Myxocyprinus asiaticus TaxID=70543 RepID=UPI00222281A4|nr:uncharacterized protein LOC127415917 [Myxocyprinus asiaticus]
MVRRSYERCSVSIWKFSVSEINGWISGQLNRRHDGGLCIISSLCCKKRNLRRNLRRNFNAPFPILLNQSGEQEQLNLMKECNVAVTRAMIRAARMRYSYLVSYLFVKQSGKLSQERHRSPGVRGGVRSSSIGCSSPDCNRKILPIDKSRCSSSRTQENVLLVTAGRVSRAVTQTDLMEKGHGQTPSHLEQQGLQQQHNLRLDLSHSGSSTLKMQPWLFVWVLNQLAVTLNISVLVEVDAFLRGSLDSVRTSHLLTGPQ